MPGRPGRWPRRPVLRGWWSLPGRLVFGCTAAAALATTVVLVHYHLVNAPFTRLTV
ncbi:hypothetical protein [Streptomyces sp. NPDC056294]|uniref:hypothetical protein n=1 Tax=Streptomyces sp. NPDC056294 TaxID=3345773 RepID=UPI0035DDF8ED